MMITFVTTLRRTALMVAALGVLTFGAFLYSLTPLASPLLAVHGAPPAISATTGVASINDLTVSGGIGSQPTIPMPPPPPINLTLGVALIAWNVGVILVLTVAVVIAQTALKRRKRSHKLTTIPR